jgi:hypothetical protein
MSDVAFRRAVEAGDLSAAFATLAPEIVFHSPVTFRPFVGRDDVAQLLSVIVQVLEDLHYVEEFQAEDGSVVLHFKARVGDREVDGIDLLRFDADGLIRDFTVMLRPLSAVTAVGEAVGARLSGSG